jgi:hypothetical protein
MAFFKRKSETVDMDKIRIKDIPENNYIDAFKASLSPELREKSIFELPRELQYELLYATMMTFYQIFENPKDMALKLQSMLSSSMCKHDIDNLEVSVSFFGSKDNVLAENFIYRIQKVPFNTELPKLSDEFADKDAKQPHKKTSSLMEQKDNVLEVFEQVRHVFHEPDSALLATCGLIINFDYMSDYNLETHHIMLQGPTISGKLTEVNYDSSFYREEILNENSLHEVKNLLNKFKH